MLAAGGGQGAGAEPAWNEHGKPGVREREKGTVPMSYRKLELSPFLDLLEPLDEYDVTKKST